MKGTHQQPGATVPPRSAAIADFPYRFRFHRTTVKNRTTDRFGERCREIKRNGAIGIVEFTDGDRMFVSVSAYIRAKNSGPKKSMGSTAAKRRSV